MYTHPRQAAGVVTGFDPAQLTEGKLLSSGFIALQAEGHPVDFRNVRLLNLEGCMDPKAANYKRYYVKSNPPRARWHADVDVAHSPLTHSHRHQLAASFAAHRAVAFALSRSPRRPR